MSCHGTRNDALCGTHIRRPYIQDQNIFALIHETPKFVHGNTVHAKAADKQVTLEQFYREIHSNRTNSGSKAQKTKPGELRQSTGDFVVKQAAECNGNTYEQQCAKSVEQEKKVAGASW